PTGELAEVVQRVGRSDALVVVTPTFQAGYSGLFKSFIDLIDADMVRGTPVLLAATGGSERHSLMIDHALRPLFAYLGAEPVPTGIFAATSDFGGGESLQDRIERAAGELVGRLGVVTATSDRTNSGGEVVPFEQLLRRYSA
ncbi:MAG: NAD(P)H-dependent oxidoreductase, partial [Propionibacterium sp.]|nr:NAD(P)H-dependent oxidoreductase [Propionibacterium sp.]